MSKYPTCSENWGWTVTTRYENPKPLPRRVSRKPGYLRNRKTTWQRKYDKYWQKNVFPVLPMNYPTP